MGRAVRTWLLEEHGRLSAWNVQSSLGAGFGEESWLQATACVQRKITLDFFIVKRTLKQAGE